MFNLTLSIQSKTTEETQDYAWLLMHHLPI